jgi:PAT family beta-lactamase induction signal transducer AmpG
MRFCQISVLINDKNKRPAMPSRPSFKDTFKLYLDPRLLRIFGLGVASGFPWVMIGSAMTAWLAEEGLSRTNIGFFGFIFVAFSINFLWSPLVDRVKIPLLGSWLGQRRSWIVLMQCLVALCCWGVATVDPSGALSVAKIFAFALALAAATQDIALDAFRIDSLPEDDSTLMAAGSAMATSGWWTGFAGLGAIPLFLADLDGWFWSDVYQYMALVMLLLALVPLSAAEPKTNRVESHRESERRYLAYFQQRGEVGASRLSTALIGFLVLVCWMIVGFPGIAAEYVYSAYLMCGLVLAALTVVLLKGLWHLNALVDSNLLAGGSNASVSRKDRMLVWVLVSFVEPLAEFFRRNEARLALSILLFIFLFKIGEAFLGRMSIVFYKELGFSNSDIALYSKLVSWWVTIGFSLIGSAVTIHYGVLRGLFIGGFAMAASNLMFAVMAFVGPSKGLLVSAVVVDGFTTAWSTVAFVAFLSMMCNRAFTASQYALMASVGTLGRTFLASYSGWVVDALDGNWALFFTITSLMVVPSMLLLYRVRHRLRQLSADF